MTREKLSKSRKGPRVGSNHEASFNLDELTLTEILMYSNAVADGLNWEDDYT